MVTEPGAAAEPGRSGGAEEAAAPLERWVVILEAAAVPAFQFHQVKQLVSRLDKWRSSGLYSLERYAVQLHMPSSRHDEALALAVEAHDQAIADLGLGTPTLLRAEVMTLDELKVGCGQTAAETQEGRTYDAMIPTALYDATRALLRASTRAQIDEVLTGFVITVGGTVNIGELRYIPGQVSVDLGLWPRDHMYATADSASVAGLMIEQSLPSLVHDAERMLVRLHLADQPNLR